MIVTASTSAVIYRHLIVMLAARHRLPAVYSYRYFATTGGQISYGANPIAGVKRKSHFKAVRSAFDPFSDIQELLGLVPEGALAILLKSRSETSH